MKVIRKIFRKCFSTTASGIYMILFAIAIAVATFIENDFGTSAAQKIIFKAWWFELLLLLFGIANLVNMFQFQLIRQKKWATLAFHASMIIILLGAAITRYSGYEGMMHIRQDSSADYFLSADTYLNFEAHQQGEKYVFSEPVLFASLGNNYINKEYIIGNQRINVEVLDFVPNPSKTMIDDENGMPTLKIVIGGRNGREEYFLKEGTKSKIGNTLFNFGLPESPNAFNIKYENGELFTKASVEYNQTVMASQEQNVLAANVYHPLALRSLYANDQERFVFGQFSPQAIVGLNAKIYKNDEYQSGRSSNKNK